MKLVITIIKFYKKHISPYFIKSCRFSPSCSEYAQEAISVYGIKGVGMSVWRILRCHPFSKGGYDPVIKKNEV